MSSLDSSARITVDELNEIMDSSLPESDLNRFINTANHLIDDELSGTGLSDARLADIELFLSAHFASMRDRRTSSMDSEGSGFDWEGDTDMGLMATTFGQQAVVLDTSGTLKNLSTGIKKFTATAIGAEETNNRLPSDDITI